MIFRLIFIWFRLCCFAFLFNQPKKWFSMFVCEWIFPSHPSTLRHMRDRFIPFVTHLLYPQPPPTHQIAICNYCCSTLRGSAVALVLPLPDPGVPEQHEKCCILCKKPPEWKLNTMHHLRCRLHHYYKPRADCILLNRREWNENEVNLIRERSEIDRHALEGESLSTSTGWMEN